MIFSFLVSAATASPEPRFSADSSPRRGVVSTRQPSPGVEQWLKASRIALAAGLLVLPMDLRAQLIDKTLAPNAANEGIAKSLADEIGAGQGDIYTPDSSAFIIACDPFRLCSRSCFSPPTAA